MLAAAFLAWFTLSPAFAETPRNRSLDRVSDHGRFHIVLQSDTVPVPQRKLHSWRMQITAPDGAPVRGAIVKVSGGMPEHRHGLPTQPKVTEENAPGAYRMDGVRFSMTGWWVLTLGVRSPDGVADTVTFNLVL